jgi:hypothetical protein
VSHPSNLTFMHVLKSYRYVGLCFGDPQMSEWHRLRLRRSAETRNKWKPGIFFFDIAV